MRLQHKIIVLAVLPLIAALLAIALIVKLQARDLAQQQAALLEDSLLGAKRTELKHYVELALTSIDHLYAAGRDDEAARKEAMRILREMNYGDDGYFFVYDSSGKNLVHPRQPELVGKNLLNMQDPQGLPVIRTLLEVAQAGGGFQRYIWHKPSSGQATEKLAYVVELKRWDWMLGTGVYLDDVAASLHKLRADGAAHIADTLLGLAAVAVLAALAVFAGGMALNISEHRLADRRLKALAQRIVTLQEDERTRVARELHDGLSQLLVATKFHFELGHERALDGRADAAPEIEKGLNGLTGAIAEIRRISHDLRSSLLDNLGLPAAIEQLAGEFSLRTGIAVDSDIRRLEIPGGDALPTTLFRIAQEALSNIERHAGASQVFVGLRAEDGSVCLTVCDNGGGFTPNSIDRPESDGIGLLNMRERIEHHGGSFSISSRPGETELVARLPRRSAEHGEAA